MVTVREKKLRKLYMGAISLVAVLFMTSQVTVSSYSATVTNYDIGKGSVTCDAAGNDGVLDNSISTIDITLKGGANSGWEKEGIGNITIENCYIKDHAYADRSAASIGAGFDSKVSNITIKKSEVYGGSIGSTDTGKQ